MPYQSFNRIQSLLDYLEIDSSHLEIDVDENSPFHFLVPFSFAEKMEKGNPNDPLLLQVLPQKNEQLSSTG